MLRKALSDSMKNPFLLFLLLFGVFWLLTERWGLAVLTFLMLSIAWYSTYGGEKNEK